jgi:formylglycine-generating enzyme required for sulfatase activity
VNLPDFYMDQTEVTNEAYARFCRDKQHPLPQGFRADRPNYPIVNITFVDAQEFAKWAGKRVPTLLEWEKAARGTDGRLFPWGNESDPARANVANKSGLMPVDSFQGGESPWHVLNLVGNAWEFVDQFQTPSEGALKAFRKLLQPPPTATEPWYTVRGGSFRQPSLGSLIYDWAAVPARYHSDDIGFRCAKDAK